MKQLNGLDDEKKGELSLEDLDAATGSGLYPELKCAKCGSTMKPDQLYCKKCYPINPDDGSGHWK